MEVKIFIFIATILPNNMSQSREVRRAKIKRMTIDHVIPEGKNITLRCPYLDSTKSIWWVRDEMTILSNDGENLSYAASLLWPESEQKYGFLLNDYSSWMTINNITSKDASNYRCILDLANPGPTHTVSVVSDLSCLVQKASERDVGFCDGISPSPSRDPSKALAPNSIRCVTRVSQNFKGNLPFNLYQLKNVTKLLNFGNLTLGGLRNFEHNASSGGKMMEGDSVRFDESLLRPKKASFRMARAGCRSRFSDLIDVLFSLNSTSNVNRQWRVEAFASDDQRKLMYDVVEEPNRLEEKRGPVENGSVSFASFTSLPSSSSSSLLITSGSILTSWPSSRESVSTGYDDAHQTRSSSTSGSSAISSTSPSNLELDAQTEEKDDIPTENDNLEFGIKGWLDKSLVVVIFSLVGSLLVVSLLSMALYFCLSRTKRRRQVSTYVAPCVTPKSSMPDIWI